MSEYMSIEVVVVSMRLRGRERGDYHVTRQLTNFSACKECGAPKGFICLGWEENGASCTSRWNAWHQSFTSR